MLTKQLKDMYHRLLTAPAGSPTAIQLLCQVLTNIHLYLVEEELKMMKAEAECTYATLCLFSALLYQLLCQVKKKTLSLQILSITVILLIDATYSSAW